MEINELKLYDRSRVTTDWTCPRKRYWNYEHNGRGVVSSNTSLDLFMGTCLHDSLAAIAEAYVKGEVIEIDLIANTARKNMYEALSEESTGVYDDDYGYEQSSLLEGMIRGFYKQVWPRLIREYPTILCVEEEMRYDHDGLTFMSKPDLIMADKEGNAVYVEYKSTSSKADGWVNGWATAVQLHSTIKAVKATKDIDISQVIVQGLYKGFTSYGKQSSPFCYAYKKSGQPPFSEDQVQYEYKAGFKRFPVWDLEGGVKDWIDNMPENVLSDQFPQVPPIFINDDLVEAFFKQRSYRENEIALATQILSTLEDEESIKNLIDVAFPQKFDMCSSYYGRDCEFKRICHGNVQDPLNEGWEERIPHHKLEIDEWTRSVQSNGLGENLVSVD